MTEAALWYSNTFNFERWREPRRKKRTTSSNPSWKHRHELSRLAELEDLARHAEALANDLKAGHVHLDHLSMVEFLDMHERVLKLRTGALDEVSSYWQISEYTDEELSAIREADKLDPDLAEYYKDLLED